MNLISVIIPAYNCESYIAKCLDSILAQTYTNFEILIGDDGSTDRTKEIIDSYQDSRVKCFHNGENRGNVYTRNRLAERASGDFICIQDADDWSDTKRLETQLSYLIKNDFQACCCKVNFVNENGELLDSDYSNILPATIMISREVYEKVGGLPESLGHIIAEDNYWLSRIGEDYEITLLNERLYFYRDHPQSLTNSLDDSKLVGVSLIKELKRQRRKNGSDWVENNNIDAIESYKNELIANKKLLIDILLMRLMKYVPNDNPELSSKIISKAKGISKFRLYSSLRYWRFLLGKRLKL